MSSEARRQQVALDVLRAMYRHGMGNDAIDEEWEVRDLLRRLDDAAHPTAGAEAIAERLDSVVERLDGLRSALLDGVMTVEVRSR